MMDLWELPRGWGWETIDDLSTQVTDGTHKTPDYVANGVRFISIQNIRRFQPIDWGGYVRYISRTEHEELIRRVKPEKNDILVSKIGTLGVAKVIDFDEEVSIFVGLALIKPDRTKLFPKYLEAVLNSPNYVQLAYRQARGAGRKTLPLIELKKFQIPIPFPHDRSKSIETQRQIVARIEALLAEVREMREINQRVIGDTRQLLDAFIYQTFVNLPEKEVKTIDEVGFVKGGKRLPKGESFAGQTTPYPYLRVTDFKNYGIDDSDLRYLAPELQAQIRNYIISDQDVFISIAGTIGLVGTVPAHLNGSNLTENAAKIVFRPEYQGKIKNKYLMYYLASSQGKKQIEERTKAAGQPKLALERIKTITFPYLDSITQQELIIEKIEAVQAEVKEMLSAQQADEKLINQLEESILAQAFQGKL